MGLSRRQVTRGFTRRGPERKLPSTAAPGLRLRRSVYGRTVTPTNGSQFSGPSPIAL